MGYAKPDKSESKKKGSKMPDNKDNKFPSEQPDFEERAALLKQMLFVKEPYENQIVKWLDGESEKVQRLSANLRKLKTDYSIQSMEDYEKVMDKMCNRALLRGLGMTGPSAEN